MRQDGGAPRGRFFRSGRIVLIVALVAALIWLDWRLASIVQTRSLEAFPAGLETEVSQDHEAVVVLDSGAVALFEQAGSGVDDVEVCVVGGALAEGTRDRLEAYVGERPPGAGEVVLFPGAFDDGSLLPEAAEDRCRARVELTAVGDGGAPVRLHAFRSAECGAGGRALGLRTEKGSVRIRFSLMIPTEGPSARGCQRTLLVGDSWEGYLAAPLGLELLVPLGGEAAFRFHGPGDDASLVPFDFGRVRSLEMWREAHDEPVLRAHGLGGPRDVQVKRLALLRDGLEVAISGAGPIEGEPEYLPRQSFQEWALAQIAAHPFLALLVGGLNVLLSRFFATYLVEKPVTALWKRMGGGRPEEKEPAETPPPEAGDRPGQPRAEGTEGQGPPGIAQRPPG
jgi:hypothetical protein